MSKLTPNGRGQSRRPINGIGDVLQEINDRLTDLEIRNNVSVPITEPVLEAEKEVITGEPMIPSLPPSPIIVQRSEKLSSRSPMLTQNTPDIKHHETSKICGLFHSSDTSTSETLDKICVNNLTVDNLTEIFDMHCLIMKSEDITCIISSTDRSIEHFNMKYYSSLVSIPVGAILGSFTTPLNDEMDAIDREEVVNIIKELFKWGFSCEKNRLSARELFITRY